MILVIILGVILCLGILEYFSLRLPEHAVHIHLETDLSLCAPGEEITLKYTVSNSSALPLFYVGVSIYFDDWISVCPAEGASEKWTLRNDLSGLCVEQRLHLGPHRVYKGKVRFHIDRRGLHTLGRYYLEYGDYLGLRTTVLSDEGDDRIVCTAPLPKEEPDFRPLGGILGEISVRRFLYEDPCLIAGYREYTGREPMKQISWLQSAKTGQLTVKQQDHTAEANVTVLLNLESGNRPALEGCLSLARSVCEKLEDQKMPYSFRSNGDVKDLAEGLGRAHLFPLLRSIGLSRLASYTPFGTLVDRCVREKRGERTFIVITDELPEAALQKLRKYSEHPVLIFNGKAGVSS